MSEYGQKLTDRERGAHDQRQALHRFTDHCALEKPLDSVQGEARVLPAPPPMESFTIQVWEVKNGRRHPTAYIVTAQDMDHAEWIALEKHRLLFDLPKYASIWTERRGE